MQRGVNRSKHPTWILHISLSLQSAVANHLLHFQMWGLLTHFDMSPQYKDVLFEDHLSPNVIKDDGKSQSD